MVAVSYEPLIRDMTWSYSRVKTFEDCKHKWYLKYILFPNHRGKDLFFASYGTLMHELLASYNKGEKTADQIRTEYIKDFKTKVRAKPPSRAVFENYFTDGLEYLKALRPSGNKILSVENKAEFSINSIPFVGYIDLVEEQDGGIILLIDNKSKVLKPRSSGKKPTKGDGELDIFLQQLYLYSYYIFVEYGQFPEKLCFNCFRKNLFIEEPFDKKAYECTIDWFLNKIEEITAEVAFRPSAEYFKCNHICEMQEYCDYYRLLKG